MKNGKLRHVLAALGAIVFLFLVGACDDADSGSDGGVTAASDGCITVSLDGASAIDTDVFYAFAFPAGEKSIYNVEKIVAVNYATITGGSASFTLKCDDGDSGPTTTDWVGDGGASYDLYVYTDGDDDGDEQPATHGGSDPAYRLANYPTTCTIDGDQTINVAFGEMVEYTGGTLEIEVTGGANGTDVMFFGVFRDGAIPGVDEPVGFCEDQQFAAGTPTSTGAIQAISDEETDPDTVWYGVDGTTYDVYVFVDLGGVNGGSNDGPNSGDKYYQFEYTQNGDESRTLALADFSDF